MPPLTAGRLRELLHYDPLTGLFTWLLTVGRRGKAGRVAGCVNEATGYVVVRIDGANYQAHRLAWFYMTGDWPTVLIDHEDTDNGNNLWTNLREATHSQNQCNRGSNCRNTSGYKGVSWMARQRKWRAVVGRTHLGCFTDKEQARLAAVAGRIKHHGDFANQGE
jgi:HNH endonuclease